ncbi:hypothetical protein [Corynebacterium variabile]|uniref:hypothetical protein n=1 Tax=Corynebacterium variabile TaxID=1727 RepID=UPI0028AF1B64|nr:hypothetical protein [Corynebacterium variabile]
MSTARAASSAASTMRRVSLRNLAGHKVRLVLTVLAVVLGTAFISRADVHRVTVQDLRHAVRIHHEGRRRHRHP